jgi:hypothetical protein
VNVQSKTGVFSQPAVFPLSFQANPVRQMPPEGVFKEQNLGPIMVTLQTVAGVRKKINGMGLPPAGLRRLGLKSQGFALCFFAFSPLGGLQ